MGMNKQPVMARPFHYIWHIPFLVRTKRVSGIHLNYRRLHHVCRWRSDRKDDRDNTGRLRADRAEAGPHEPPEGLFRRR